MGGWRAGRGRWCACMRVGVLGGGEGRGEYGNGVARPPTMVPAHPSNHPTIIGRCCRLNKRGPPTLPRALPPTHPPTQLPSPPPTHPSSVDPPQSPSPHSPRISLLSPPPAQSDGPLPSPLPPSPSPLPSPLYRLAASPPACLPICPPAHPGCGPAAPALAALGERLPGGPRPGGGALRPRGTGLGGLRTACACVRAWRRWRGV